jgi:hypothetical protein
MTELEMDFTNFVVCCSRATLYNYELQSVTYMTLSFIYLLRVITLVLNCEVR